MGRKFLEITPRQHSLLLLKFKGWYSKYLSISGSSQVMIVVENLLVNAGHLSFLKFVLIYSFYLEANYFIILWWFLSYIDMNQPWVYMCSPSWTPSILPPHPIPQGHTSAPALSTLSFAWNLDWQSVSYMIIYMFQCYSLKSSHPCFLPQSSEDCCLHLCLFCCLAYRVIVTIFLNSLYMCVCVLVFFFLAYFTLYNGVQFHLPH